jgi:uncharacterized protein (TIGR00266 family)
MSQETPKQSYDTLALIDEKTKGEFQSGYGQQQQQSSSTSSAFIYQIKGRPAFAFGDIYLSNGQRVIADTKSLLWMDGNIQVETSLAGGSICSSILRSMSGESCCLNTYIGNSSDNNKKDKVSVGFELPGDIMAFGVTNNNGWVFTYDAFIAGTNNLQISSRFSSCCACMFADQSVFLTTCKVKEGEMGVVLAGSYGMIERHDVPDQQTLLVSKGLFFAAREDTQFEVGLIGQECGGLLNLGCTGGGIVYRFKGPCVIYTQSKSPIQLLKDFGIPMGKRTIGTKVAQIGLKIVCAILENAGKAQQ